MPARPVSSTEALAVRSHRSGSNAPASRERDREDRVVAVQHVEPEDQRDAQPALLDRHALQPVEPLRAVDVEHAADQPAGDLAFHLGFAAGRHPGVDHVELPELLLERHGREEALDDVGHGMLPGWLDENGVQLFL